MAAEQEYGKHLQRRFEPLFTGVGPVEAGTRLSGELAGRDARGQLPELVVSLGSAGSNTLEQCGVYQAVSVSYRDMDASALGFEKGQTPFLDIPVTLPLRHRVPGIAEARLSSGAAVISGEAYDHIDADMVDMETFAHVRACQQFDVPLIGLRGISDGKEALNHVDDWLEYLHIIDKKLSDAVDALESALSSGKLSVHQPE